MTHMTRRQWSLATLGMLALPAARAQDKSVIRILVGFPPGGATDAIARQIAEGLREELGQPVMVENRPGVGGRLAADNLMAAAPDGLTYMIAPNATPTFQVLVFGDQLKWDLFRDFAPVAGLVSYPLGMAVALNTGVTNVSEFIAWVKANPQRASFGTPGLGGQNHFLGVQFAKVAGIDLPVVPYKGSPPLMTDLMGGHVPAAVTLMDEMRRQHHAGRVRVIGTFTAKRSELTPDIPTFAEQGVDVTSGEGWNAMWAPAGTPAAELQRVQDALQRALAKPAMREALMTRLAVVPTFRDAKEMERLQRAEIATWKGVIQESGFKPE